MPAVMPWMVISLFLQTYILYFGFQTPKNLQPAIVFTILLNLITLTSAIGYFLFERLRRRANTQIYKKQNDRLWRVIEFPLNFIAVLFFITVPTSIIGAFGALGGPKYKGMQGISADGSLETKPKGKGDADEARGSQGIVR